MKHQVLSWNRRSTAACIAAEKKGISLLVSLASCYHCCSNGHVKPVALTRLLFNRADIRVMGVGGRAYAKDCPAVLFIIKVCYCPI